MRTVRQLLETKSPEVFSIAPDAPVIDAIRLMAERRIGALLVMEGPRLAGRLGIARQEHPERRRPVAPLAACGMDLRDAHDGRVVLCGAVADAVAPLLGRSLCQGRRGPHRHRGPRRLADGDRLARQGHPQF